MNDPEVFMKRCIELAENGLGHVAPNPMVGAVIVSGEEIIGEGFHSFFGGPHAEVNAINSVKNPEKLKESILYINLEPCSHHGKTPPCTDLIINSGIPEVVISNTDPNPEVAGSGIEALKKNGIKVKTGILEEEGEYTNRRFFAFHKEKRPFIILKWAQTLDGFMDIERVPGKQGINRISNQQSKRYVHWQRSIESAVLIGKNTALNDNPKLTVRDVHGNNPLRIVIDENLELPGELNLFNGTVETLVINGKLKEQKNNVEFVKIDFSGDVIMKLLNLLHKRNILSLIVEGGPATLSQFIDRSLWDEAFIFRGNKRFHKGLQAPDFPHEPSSETNLGDNLLSHYTSYS